MHDDQRGSRRQIRGHIRNEGHRILARFGRRLQNNHTFVGEQRRAEQFGQLAGADLTGTQPVHRDVVGARLFTDASQHTRYRPLDQQLLVAEYQVQA